MNAPGPGTSRRVVITGAAGRIGTAVSSRLPGPWRLHRTDVRAAEGVAELDVTDVAACRAAFAGSDAVIHLAGNPDPGAAWEDLLGPNVVGAYTVARAAADCRVRRLVLASSNQALSAHPPERQLRTADPPRPSNLYGATKAWAEAIGSWLAATTATTVVAVRIAHFELRRPTVEDTHRNRAAWLSPDDAAEVLRAAVEGPVDGFLIVNGVSANRYRFAELGASEAGLGYRPRDDAWADADDGEGFEWSI